MCCCLAFRLIYCRAPLLLFFLVVLCAPRLFSAAALPAPSPRLCSAPTAPLASPLLLLLCRRLSLLRRRLLLLNHCLLHRCCESGGHRRVWWARWSGDALAVHPPLAIVWSGKDEAPLIGPSIGARLPRRRRLLQLEGQHGRIWRIGGRRHGTPELLELHGRLEAPRDRRALGPAADRDPEASGIRMVGPDAEQTALRPAEGRPLAGSAPATANGAGTAAAFPVALAAASRSAPLQQTARRQGRAAVGRCGGGKEEGEDHSRPRPRHAARPTLR